MSFNRLNQYFSQPSAAKGNVSPVPTTELEERQQLLAHHVRLVARRRSNGLFIYSRGGLGKSRVVLQTLADERVRPVVMTAHVTPLSLYQSLYAQPEAVFFLDDCETLFASPVGLGLFELMKRLSVEGFDGLTGKPGVESAALGSFLPEDDLCPRSRDRLA